MLNPAHSLTYINYCYIVSSKRNSVLSKSVGISVWAFRFRSHSA